MATSSGELFALVRFGRVVSVGSQAAAEADRLSQNDQVVPVITIEPPADHICAPGTPAYEVVGEFVERRAASRPLTVEERRVQVQQRRAAEYPAIGDQLDAIAKGFAGLDPSSLPAATREWMAQLQAVKSAHPKE